MKCSKCTLFHSWNNESDRGESCGLFGDAWDNDLQYEDDAGCIVGCYVDRHYIEKVNKRYMEYMEQEALAYEEWIENGGLNREMRRLPALQNPVWPNWKSTGHMGLRAGEM